MNTRNRNIVKGFAIGMIVAGLSSLLISFFSVLLGSTVAGYLMKDNKKVSAIVGALIGAIVGIWIGYMISVMIAFSLHGSAATLNNTGIAFNATVQNTLAEFEQNIVVNIAEIDVLSIILGTAGGLIGWALSRYFKKGTASVVLINEETKISGGSKNKRGRKAKKLQA